MKIKNGYNGKELQIRVGNSTGRTAEVWVEFKQKNPPEETLSYATLNELMDLKDEIQNQINRIVGAKEND